MLSYMLYVMLMCVCMYVYVSMFMGIRVLAASCQANAEMVLTIKFMKYDSILVLSDKLG